MDRSLKRIFKRLKVSLDAPPSQEQWVDVVRSIEKLLSDGDEGRRLLERALLISSEEMRQSLEKQKEINLELAQASKMLSLGTLATGIAHELNNPLAGIQGHAELLMEGQLDKKDLHRADRILKLTERMTNIVQHLLTLSRKPQSNLNSKFQIRKAIIDSLAFSEIHFKYENIVIQNEISSDDLWVHGDIHGITTVFQNLINNAYDEFLRKRDNPQGVSRICIKVDKDKSTEDTVVISVSDNAGGISQDKISRVFDPFYTTKQVGSGTGLGLSLSRKIMSESGGFLTVESAGEDTTFFLSLPRSSPESVNKSYLSFKEAVRVSNVERIDAYKRKILIVDDEIDILDILEDRLCSDYLVTSTTSSVEALQILYKDKFDVLVTDLKMPVMSGKDLIEVAFGINDKMKVIAMSGHVEASHDLSLLQGNQNTVKLLSKPLPSKKDLLKIIRELNLSTAC